MAAIAVACLILYTAYRLIISSGRVLLDETLPESELEMIRACVKEHRGDLIVGYHRLRARRAGSRRHIDLHIEVDERMSVREAHDVAEHIEPTSGAACPTWTSWCTSNPPRRRDESARRIPGSERRLAAAQAHPARRLDARCLRAAI